MPEPEAYMVDEMGSIRWTGGEGSFRNLAGGRDWLGNLLAMAPTLLFALSRRKGQGRHVSLLFNVHVEFHCTVVKVEPEHRDAHGVPLHRCEGGARAQGQLTVNSCV